MPFLRRLAALVLAIAMVAWWRSARPAGGPLDIGEGVGPLTAVRLAALDRPACGALLDRAGIAYRALPRRAAPAHCALADGVAWRNGGSRAIAYAPPAPALACPLAAALAVWEWDVVQPAAFAILGSPVARIDHYGSFACRRVYGRATGSWSGHATARAIDVAGFRLADGRRITVAGDWSGSSSAARFLHAVRDGGCRTFTLTLSPDYNAAHRDHLHLEEAGRFAGVCQ